MSYGRTRLGGGSHSTQRGRPRPTVGDQEGHQSSNRRPPPKVTTRPANIHQFDYGVLEGPTASDGGGISCWRGSLAEPILTDGIAHLSVARADLEVKRLIGSTEQEMVPLANQRSDNQAGLLVRWGR